MFLSYYGLREQPFGVTPDPRFLYETAVHREALASLLYGIESGLGFTALLAPPGMGKTTLLFHLLDRYRQRAQSAFVFDTQCTSHEFLQELCADLDLATSGTDAELRARFREYLAKQAGTGRRVLVLIDEAQNLSETVLETVRLLSNFETPRQKLLHIILSGQPQLEANLAKPEMVQLRQRIALFTRLAPFASEDTAAYIEHRLKVAGYRGRPLFTPNALAIISAESHGVPREINRMCFNALSLGFALHKPAIDAEVLYEVINDLRLGSEPMPPIAWHGLVGGKWEHEAGASPPAVAQTAEKPQAPLSPEPPRVAAVAAMAVEPVPADPFTPRARREVTQPTQDTPKAALVAEHDAPVAAAPTQAEAVRASQHAPPPALQTRSVAKAAAKAPASAMPPAPEPQPPQPAPTESADELSAEAAADPNIAVQRALLGVALKSHHHSTYVPLAGVALAIPLVLWILAYLIFRFDLVNLLRH